MTEQPEHTSSTLPESQPATSTRAAFLALVGILISCYLLYHHVAVNYGYQTEPSLCNFGGTFDCEEVARSSYSAVFGIPLASYGLFYYAFLLGFCFLLRPGRNAETTSRRNYADVLLLTALLSLPPTLSLFCISMFVIGKVCLFCSAQYLLNIVLAFVTLRNPERSRPLGTSLLNGVRMFPGTLLGSKTSLGRSHRVGAFLFLCISLLTAVIAAFAPSLLLTHVFMPRDSAAVIDKVYEDWQKVPVVELPVNTSDVVLERDFTLGPDAAPIHIVVFSDFQCPFCKRAAKLLEGLVAKFKGSVQLIFKNYPLDSSCNDAVQNSPHTFACQAALLARCSGLQGQEFFWRMHDALFELESVEWEMETLFALPEQISLNTAEMDRCLTEDAVMRRIKEDIALGDKVDIQGTPAIFVNGRLTQLARTEHLEQLLQRILKHQNDG